MRLIPTTQNKLLETANKLSLLILNGISLTDYLQNVYPYI